MLGICMGMKLLEGSCSSSWHSTCVMNTRKEMILLSTWSIAHVSISCHLWTQMALRRQHPRFVRLCAWEWLSMSLSFIIIALGLTVLQILGLLMATVEWNNKIPNSTLGLLCLTRRTSCLTFQQVALSPVILKYNYVYVSCMFFHLSSLTELLLKHVSSKTSHKWCFKSARKGKVCFL